MIHNEKNVYVKYKKSIKKLKMNLLLKKVKLPAMYNKVIRNFILKSNLMTMKIISNQNKVK